jgi:hypothetical protein
MMGSGTVLAVARAKGHRAIGVDIDPLARLISGVWTRAIDVRRVRSRADDVLERAQSRLARLPQRDAYPINADPETRQFVAYWFDGYARRQLSALSGAILGVRDAKTREVLWCGFSRLIIAKQAGASLAMDLSHSRPHRVFRRAPQKPFRNFLSAVDRVLANCIDTETRGRGPAPRIYEGDARALPLGNESIDLVLTSPPYLNAIDYMRLSKFSLVWMGHTISELRRIRSTGVGSEVGRRGEPDNQIRAVLKQLQLRPALVRVDEAVLERYIDDMRRALAEVARVLVPGGKAVYVIGENTIRSTYIRNSVIVAALARLAGMRLTERRVRALPGQLRYLPPPSPGAHGGGLDGRMRREVILIFAK